MLPIEEYNERFNSFLRYRGVDRVVDLPQSNLSQNNQQPTGGLQIIQGDSDNDDFYQQDSELLDSSDVEASGSSEPRDADIFYRHTRLGHYNTYDSSASDTEIEEDLAEIIEEDKCCEYKSNSNYNLGEFSLVDSDQSDDLQDQNKWEFVNKLEQLSDSNSKASDKIASDADSFASIAANSRSKSFQDGIELKFVDKTKLLHVGSIRRFKNNLTCVIKSSNNSYLVVADNSELSFFELGHIDGMPSRRAKLRFGTQPIFTSATDRLVSTWPRYPHSINFLKVFDDFCGQQILVACSDDGRLMIWYCDKILEYIAKARIGDIEIDDNDELYHSNRFNSTKVHPDFKIKMESSTWGVDFTLTVDQYGACHNVFVASDNSQSATFLYFHIMDNQFYHIKSHQILHNIPDVSFVSYQIIDGCHNAKVSCASISQELIIFQFKFRLVMGPLSAHQQRSTQYTHYVDPHMEAFEAEENGEEYFDLNSHFQRLSSQEPVVLARTLLGEWCWTTKHISSKYFQTVSSLSAVFGNSALDETNELQRISAESKILSLAFDPMKSSNPGYGSYFQFYECLTKLFSGKSDTSPRFSTIDDEYRRLRKGIFKIDCTMEMNIDTNCADYRPDFLTVSTATRVGLFQADTLFCNSGTQRVFDMRIPSNSETEHCDRISISQLIPDLLCLIVVTQLGLISIFRLCEYKGIYGMRQEHVFPNAATIALSEDGFRTIVGITLQDKSLSSFYRYLLYVVYSDGLVLVYRLLLELDEWVVTRL